MKKSNETIGIVGLQENWLEKMIRKRGEFRVGDCCGKPPIKKW
jgi:hypothetical protein